MKKIILLTILSVPSLLTGCASVVNGTTQSFAVTTPPAEGARCLLKNSKGEWYIDKTPGSTTIHRAYGDLEVNCEKIGYQNGSVNVKSKTHGSAFGNIILGGVIGAGVDVANGSAYSYPSSVEVPMKKVVDHSNSKKG